MTWFAPEGEIATAPAGDGAYPAEILILTRLHQLPRLGFFGLYWAAVVQEHGICMQLPAGALKKIAQRSNFCPVPLILAVGPPTDWGDPQALF